MGKPLRYRKTSSRERSCWPRRSASSSRPIERKRCQRFFTPLVGMLADPLPAEKFGIELIRAIDQALETVFLSHVVMAALGQSARQVRIAQQTKNGSGQRLRILGRNQEPGLTVLDDLDISTDMAGHHGQTSRQVFQ